METTSQPIWAKLVGTVQDLRGYKEVTHSMFEDGRVNAGRLLVLKLFTNDVCASVDHPEPIRQYYENRLLPELMRQQP